MFIVSRDVDGLGKTVIQAISFSATANSYTTDLCVQLHFHDRASILMQNRVQRVQTRDVCIIISRCGLIST